MRLIAFTGCLLFSAHFFGQECRQLTEGAVKRLERDISFLASDKLEGRYPGTEGLEAAARYIEKQFSGMGLMPLFDGTYRQEFIIPVEVIFNEKNTLVINGDSLKVKSDYHPVRYSSNGSISGKAIYVKYGITAPEKEYDDYEKLKRGKLKDKIFVMDVSSPDGIHPHSEYLKYHDLGERIERARKKGAAGVILINEEGTANDISSDFKTIRASGIPVVFIGKSEWASKAKKAKKVFLTTNLQERKVEAANIGARINTGARSTIVIGAHYDHLGMGGSNSLYKGEPAVHNGADDNASGTAGLLELARNIRSNIEDYKEHNYIFLAFSGEEMGLLGSSHFADAAKEEAAKRYTCMLNMDMIGRMEDNLLAVNGVGTSPLWPELLKTIECPQVKVKTSESGVGPSDHTSFYYLDIPVLHFFTGTHSDYHKPTDDAEKVNYKGEVSVLSYILTLVERLQKVERMEFSATKEQSMAAPKFSVTLGVMPDYMFEGEGMRIDGVSEGKPAANAGLQKGDVVTRLGEVKVVDMMSYMKALGQFKKSDETTVEFLRDGKQQKTTVKF